jgi:hypothetical protein
MPAVVKPSWLIRFCAKSRRQRFLLVKERCARRDEDGQAAPAAGFIIVMSFFLPLLLDTLPDALRARDWVPHGAVMAIGYGLCAFAAVLGAGVAVVELIERLRFRRRVRRSRVLQREVEFARSVFERADRLSADIDRHNASRFEAPPAAPYRAAAEESVAVRARRLQEELAAVGQLVNELLAG